MINGILAYLMISSILNFIFRKNVHSNTLNCGIWGYYGKKGRPGFDWTKFDWIGCENDSRGGDACGRIVGSYIEHSNDSKSNTYKKYIRLNLPPAIRANDKIILGHTRKMSPIYKDKSDIAYAQPILYFNDDESLKSVAVHNGTIYNHKEMLEEYGLQNMKYTHASEKGKVEVEINDSQALMYLIAKQREFGALLKYNGAAAFAFYDYQRDELALWSGASKNTEYSKPTLERQLYMIKSKNHVWFSSEEDPLILINYSEDDEVEEVPENTLLFFKDGQMTSELKFDRSECFQYNRHEYKNKAKSQYKDEFCFNTGNYGEYGEYDDYMSGDYIKAHKERRILTPEVSESNNDKGYTLLQCNNCAGTGEISNGQECMMCKGQGFRKVDKKGSKTETNSSSFNSIIENEEIPEANNELIKYSRGRYYYRGAFAHGILHINHLGCVSYRPVRSANSTTSTNPYYFICGNMIKDHAFFMKLAFEIKAKTIITTGLAREISKGSIYPVYVPMRSIMISNEALSDVNEVSTYMYTGSYVPLFSSYRYWFNEGNFQSKIYQSDGTNFPKQKIIDVTGSHELPFDEVEIEIPETVDSAKMPFDVDTVDAEIEDYDIDEPYDQMIKKEIESELANLLIAVDCVQQSLFSFGAHKMCVKVDQMCDDIKEAVGRINLI